MKKITLFIAFLAISIGAVWAEEWTVVGGSNDVSAPNCSTTFINLSSTSTQIVHVYYPVERFKKTSNGHDDYMVYSVQGVKFYTNNLTSATVNGLSVGFEHVGSVPETNNTIPSTTAGTATVANNVLTITLGQIVTFPNLTNINSGYIHMQLTLTLSNVTSSETNSATWQGCTIDETVLPKTTLSCVRKFPEVTDDNYNVFNVYSSLDDDISAYSELVQFGFYSSQHKYLTYCPEASYSGNSTLCFEEYEVYNVPPSVSFDFGSGSQDVTLRKIIGNTPFYDSDKAIRSNTAIVIPNQVNKIGTEGTDNKAFNLHYTDKNATFEVAFIFDTKNSSDLPVLIGNTFDNVFSTYNYNNNSENIINLYFMQGTAIDGVTGGSFSSTNNPNWTSAYSKAKKSGYASPFYTVSSYNAYEANVDGSHKITNELKYDYPIYISSLPFDTNPLKIRLDQDKYYGSNDGSFHQYYEFEQTGDRSTTTTSGEAITYEENGKQLSITLNQDADITIRTKCDAQLRYGEGTPRYTYGDDINKKTNLFENCRALIFKLYKESNGTYNNDKVPYWYYVGNNEHKTIQASAPIHVEKEITSDHYRYFSLPFECPISVNNIDVRLLDEEDGKPSGNPLPIYDQTTITESTSPDQDYVIINEYKGQQSGNEGLPEYDIVTSGNLSANKGYAFAIVESNDNSGKELKALITFKSEYATNTMYSNTYDALTIQVQCNNCEAQTAEQNKGWNMIGNPFYHYLKPNSFYGDNVEESTSHPIKYISLIDDTDNEMVHHYWVNEQKNYHNPNVNDEIGQATESKIQYIKPFQAFFVQLSSSCNSVTVYPNDADFTYSNSNSTSLPSVSRIPAEEEEIQEHLSVKVTGQDGSFDRTTVINDESRDEHFKMMDDLAKIMNPGVQIYTWYDSVPCAFKELPMRADSTMAIPLGVRVEEAGNYTFALDTNLTFFYGAAMLHDKQANLYYPLNENGVQVALTEGENNTRFEIVVVPSEIPADVETVETSETLDAYVHDGRLVVENIEEGSTLSIYDFSGKMLYNAPAAGDFNYQFSAHGVYMVVLQGNTTGSIKVIY